MYQVFVVVSILIFSSAVYADPPTRPIQTFGAAKKIAQKKIYGDHLKTIYCGCDLTWKSTTSGGTVQSADCGYKPRKNARRGERTEWEHILPASYFGRDRKCWKTGHPKCVKKGKPYKGRSCCAKYDHEFERMESDLHNLAPAVGELNGDRSAHPYGEIPGEARSYGKCDFEINLGAPKGTVVAEPADNVKGNVARVSLYMSETYGFSLPSAQREMFLKWHKLDPPDRWEKLRDQRIEAVQGNKNPWVWK